MIVDAKKMFKLANKCDYLDVEQAIIKAAYNDKYGIIWNKELSKTTVYDLISAGYEVEIYDNKFLISWKNAGK